MEGFFKDFIDLGTAVALCALYSLLHRENIRPVVWTLLGLVCPMRLHSSQLDMLDGGCKTTDTTNNADVIYRPLEPSVIPYLNINNSCGIYVVYKIRTY